MNTLPTVRVAHPGRPGRYMTINAAEYDAEKYGELWPEQEDGFAGLPEPEPTAYTTPEREAAAALAFAILELDASMRGERFSAKTPTERLTCIRDRRNELELHKQNYFKSRAEGGEALRGFMVNVSTELTPHVEGSASVQPAAASEPAPQDAPAAAPSAPQAPEGQPAQPQAPAWAKEPEKPAVLKAKAEVNVGIGGKFYITLNGKPIDSKLKFATATEAQAALDAMIAEGKL